MTEEKMNCLPDNSRLLPVKTPSRGKIMRRLTIFLALLATALLSGCGGSRPVSTSTSTPSGTNPATPPASTIARNWQFSATSSVSGNPPLAIAGSIGQNGSSISGALHVEGSSCFDQQTIMGLNGTVSDGSTSLTSTSLNGQVVTFTGNFLDNAFAGTYSVNGGCDNGDKGSVTGIAISLADADGWSGNFTSSAQTTFNGKGNFAQSASASSEGSLGITGTASFDSPCFSSATLSPGTFPSGNFILGSLVSLEVVTDNGTLTFIGTVDPSTEIINGTYKVVGGTCDQTGTAVLALGGQWDY